MTRPNRHEILHDGKPPRVAVHELTARELKVGNHLPLRQD